MQYNHVTNDLRTSPARRLLRRGLATQSKAADDSPILWREGGVVALILIAEMRGSYIGTAIMALLILWALHSVRAAIQSLTISVLVTNANRMLVGSPPLLSTLKWILFYVCFFRVIASVWRWRRLRAGWFWPGLSFIIVCAILAITSTTLLSLSLEKLASFAIGVLTMLIGVQDPDTPRGYWKKWIVTNVSAAAILSAPFLFTNAGTYMGGFFQGILIHPQTYGIYIVPVAVYLSSILISSGRLAGVLPPIVLWMWASIFLSNCRTAMLATALSVITTGAILLLSDRLPIDPGRARIWIVIASALSILAVTILIFEGDAVANLANRFIFKTSDSNRSLTSSRDTQIDGLLGSIENHPLTGVGFGIAPGTEEQSIERDSITGLAVGASSEQGFLPLAIVNQVGALGTPFFLLFLGAIIFPIVRNASVPVMAMFWTALFVNLGETIFFSFGGLGQQMWLIFAIALVDDRGRAGAVRV